MIQIALRRRAAAGGRSRATDPDEPAERVDVVSTSASSASARRCILHNTAGEASTRRRSCASTSSGGGGKEERVPEAAAPVERSCPKPNAERIWPLTFEGLAPARRGRSTALGFGLDRIDCRPRLGHDRSCGRASTTPSARTRCTCTATTSADRRVDGQPPHPGDRAWKDTVPVLAEPDGRRPAVLRLLRRALRVPLPRRRARRHVDDGPDGGGRA